MESRIIENAEKKVSFEPFLYDLFVNDKLTAKGTFTKDPSPSEAEVKLTYNELMNKLNSDEKTEQILIDKVTGMITSKRKYETADVAKENWKFKVAEIVDENNIVNIKVNDIIELSEKMKSRTAGGSFISNEEKLIATFEENVGLLIIESIRID